MKIWSERWEDIWKHIYEADGGKGGKVGEDVAWENKKISDPTQQYLENKYAI